MSMQSSVGNAQIHEANEQRPNPNEDNTTRFEEGKPNAHAQGDIVDTRSLGNRAAAAAKAEKEKDEADAAKTITDPLAPARSHGNEPSRGAKIDAEIQAEEEEELRRKGKI